MGRFTTEKIAEFYKRVGLSKAEFFDGKKPVNLFKILQAVPEVDAEGNRIKTPYELLGVFPNFKDGVEKPIVFAIKNRIFKIGNYEGAIKDFVYKKQKIKEEKTVMQTLKERYRAAIFAGDEAAAESCLEMISNLSSNEAREFEDTFYNYTKFYRRMKKQLLIDLFAHFFLEFVQTKSTIVKNGIIKKDRLYKAYKENSNNYNQDVTFDSELDIISMGQKTSSVNPVNFAMQNVKKVVVENKETDTVSKFEISKDEVKVTTNGDAQNLQNTQPEIIEGMVAAFSNQVAQQTVQETPKTQEVRGAESIDEYDAGFFGTIKSFINKKRKPFKKIGAIPNMIHDEMEEEKIPFSKVEKYQSKEWEIEI